MRAVTIETKTQETKWIKSAAACREYNIPPHKFYQWRIKGLLKPFGRISKGSYLYLREDVERFVAEMADARLKKEMLKSKPKVVHAGYIYLFKSDEFYKIGRSHQPEIRFKAVAASVPFETKFIHKIYTDDTKSAERFFHAKFAQKRVKGEWFRLETKDIEYIKSFEVWN